MGVRGPVPKSNRRAAHLRAVVAEPRRAPKAPKHLDADRSALWARLFERCSWLDPDLDAEAATQIPR